MVSIHTPTKGVTGWRQAIGGRHQGFNPHTHEGCDVNYSIDKDGNRTVSIHTPTKGVTYVSSINSYLGYMFQSTHPRRVWPSMWSWKTWWRKFQSTHPRRVWLDDWTEGWIYRGFNPHTHEGCDCLQLLWLVWLLVSIHTPTKGVTDTAFSERAQRAVSIHTPTKGVTY